MRKITKKLLKACSAEELNVVEARKMADLKAVGSGKRLHRTIDAMVVREQYEILTRLYFPNKESMSLCISGENALPVILYIHGGGWSTDGVDNYGRICNKLARYTEHLVISIDYRLAPEYKFPVGLLDCYEVVRAVCMDQFAYAINHSNITVMGDSAGGNLTAVVCQMARDQGEFQVRNQVLIYPVVNNDYSEQSPYGSIVSKGEEFVLTAGKMRDYLSLYKSGEEDLENPYLAPILAKDFMNLPRALVITAENDPLRDEGEDYGKRLREAGNEVEIYRVDGAIHGYFGVGINSPYVRETLGFIDRFLKE